MLKEEVESKVRSYPFDQLKKARDALLLSKQRSDWVEEVQPPFEMKGFSVLSIDPDKDEDSRFSLKVPLKSCRLSCCATISDYRLLRHMHTTEHCCHELGASHDALYWIDRYLQKCVGRHRYHVSKIAEIIDPMITFGMLNSSLKQGPAGPPRRRL